MEQIELEKLAWETWSEDQKLNPFPCNPSPYVAGFKAGYKTAFKSVIPEKQEPIKSIHDIRGNIPVNKVITIVLEYFGNEKLSELISESREHPIVYKRQVLMTFLKQKTKLSLSDIGKVFKRDHTTVLHSLKVIDDYMFSDEGVLQDMEIINNKLTA